MANRRRRNNAGADEIAQAIHRMVDAMQPIATQPRVVEHPHTLWRWRTLWGI